MKNTFTILLLAAAQVAMAQIQRSSGNKPNQRIASVAYLNNGIINNVAAGNLDVPIIIDPVTTSTSFVSAYDYLGDYVWNNVVTNADELVITSTLVTSTQDIIVIGYTNPTISIIGTPYNMVAFKYNSSGTLLWSKIYKIAGIEQAHAIVEDKKSNLHIVGSAIGLTEGGKDVALLNIDSNGDVIKYYTYGTIQNEWGTDIDILPNGNYVISGTVDEKPQLIQRTDQLYLEINPDYKLVKAYSLGRDQDDEADEIEVLIDGSVRLIGYVTGHGKGLKDISVTAIDVATLTPGSILTSLYSGTGDERAYSFAGNIHDPLSRNNIKNNVLVGYTESFNKAGKDALVLEIGYDGTINDSYVYRTDEEEVLYDVTNDTLNRYFYGGYITEDPSGLAQNKFYGYNDYYNSNDTRGCRLELIELKLQADSLKFVERKNVIEAEDYKVQVVQRPYDVYKLALGCDIVTTATDALLEGQAQVSPNPATEELVIKGWPEQFSKYEVYNAKGQLVHQSTLQENVNCSQWPTGMYLLKLYTETNLYRNTFVKK